MVHLGTLRFLPGEMVDASGAPVISSYSVRVLPASGLPQAAEILVDTALKLIPRNWARLGLLHPGLLRGPDRKATLWA